MLIIVLLKQIIYNTKSKKASTMKKIIFIYNTFEQYSEAYKNYTAAGFSVCVVLGMDLALCISGNGENQKSILSINSEREKSYQLLRILDMLEQVERWISYEENEANVNISKFVLSSKTEWQKQLCFKKAVFERLKKYYLKKSAEITNNAYNAIA